MWGFSESVERAGSRNLATSSKKPLECFFFFFFFSFLVTRKGYYTNLVVSSSFQSVWNAADLRRVASRTYIRSHTLCAHIHIHILKLCRGIYSMYLRACLCKYVFTCIICICMTVCMDVQVLGLYLFACASKVFNFCRASFPYSAARVQPVY